MICSQGDMLLQSVLWNFKQGQNMSTDVLHYFLSRELKFICLNLLSARDSSFRIAYNVFVMQGF